MNHTQLSTYITARDVANFASSRVPPLHINLSARLLCRCLSIYCIFSVGIEDLQVFRK